MLRTAGKAGRRWLFVSLILYLGLRVIALTRVGLLEDRDSSSLILGATVQLDAALYQQLFGT